MSQKLPLADIAFIADFATFARSKGDETYDYCEPGDCALAQFLRASGRAIDPSVSGYGLWHDAAKSEAWECHKSPAGVHGAINPDPCGEWFSFSGLAVRLEALIADAPTILEMTDGRA